MPNQAATLLTYANLQMAAEALLDRFSYTTAAGLKSALEFGNNRSSKFTPTQAAQFLADGWTVVQHKTNTATGFSGTLFKNTVIAIAARHDVQVSRKYHQRTNRHGVMPAGSRRGRK